MKNTYLIYIAGPYTPVTHDVNGHSQPHYPVAYNVRLAAETAHSVVSALSHAGIFPITPHMNTAFFEETHPDIAAEYWLDGTRELMLKCDAVLLVNHPALETSVGSRCEVIAAINAGIPVYTSIEEVAANFTCHPGKEFAFEPNTFDEDCNTTTRRADYLIRRAKESAV
ncbi:nucleoside 2-deoxyribosyltransferase [Providencia phage vB_PreS-PibeRecoleta]|uniref:DUF1937 domain-containing protein n=1 Tax=Providencia phage vB_PreS-PibeRecoleta TaxID=2761109 RepID=A0A7G5B0X1_9CAUD|nr:nucleoside 2-deoxyribosyltransferase [Providencia phage vB_PreS-PibeRecoleta]QMV29944.1 hypothetical protein [Providencia phage vB_PreS-PibeRecoleta]